MPDKKLLSTIQLIALCIALVGGAFKLMHWPGANIMLIVGLGTLSMYYIINGLQPEAKSRNAVFIHYARNFSTAILIQGVLCKLMHWPQANLMILVGAGGVAFNFVLGLILPGKKGEEE